MIAINKYSKMRYNLTNKMGNRVTLIEAQSGIKRRTTVEEVERHFKILPDKDPLTIQNKKPNTKLMVEEILSEVTAKKPKAQTNPKDSTMISLSQICEELDITPNKARRILRLNDFSQTDGRWEWLPEKAKKAKDLLKSKI